jgi:prolyl-tRNA synthetase
VIPIWRKEQEREQVAEYVARVRESLAGSVRLQVDWDDEHTPGWKFNEWELRGVPLRLEIGPRDVKNGQVVLVRRDTRAKEMVPFENVRARAGELLEEIQADLLKRAEAFMESRTRRADSYEQFKQVMESEQRGFILAHWCDNPECESRIKDETGASIRCIPIEAEAEEGACLLCGGSSSHRVVFGRSY